MEVKMSLSHQELVALQSYLINNPLISDKGQLSLIQSYMSMIPESFSNPSSTRIKFVTLLPDNDKANLYRLDKPSFSFLNWMGELYRKKTNGLTLSPIVFSDILLIPPFEIDSALIEIDAKVQEERLTDLTVPQVIREIFRLTLDKTDEAEKAPSNLLIALLTDQLINLNTGLVFYVELKNKSPRWQSLGLSAIPTTNDIDLALNVG